MLCVRCTSWLRSRTPATAAEKPRPGKLMLMFRPAMLVIYWEVEVEGDRKKKKKKKKKKDEEETDETEERKKKEEEEGETEVTERR